MKKFTAIIVLLLAQISSGSIFGINYSSYSINNLLVQTQIYSTGQIYGTVTDTISGDSLFGVSVTTGGYTTQTDTSGYYELTLDEGTYDLEFSFLGYESKMTTIVVASGSVSEETVSMYVVPNAVPWVVSVVDSAEYVCTITWGKPQGNHMILYDDDEVDDYLVWTIPGNAVGVRFSPKGYPAIVTGGRLNVGDGSFPPGANFIGTQFAVGIFDDDGVNGLPGTIYDSVIVSVDNYDWINFYNCFDITFDEGDFYIVMWQLGDETNSAPIAIDTDLTSFYNSVTLQQGAGWAESSDQNFMIRAYVNGVYYINNYPDCQYYSHYVLSRVSDFDPDLGPETGTLTPIALTTDEIYCDIAFGGLSPGFYTYGVKAMYPQDDTYVYSNVIHRGIENEVTIEIELCNGELPEGVQVTLSGNDYPYDSFFDVSDTSGVVVFDSVIDGTYNLRVYKPGYESYEDFLVISDNMHYSVILDALHYPVRNFLSDSLTSVITWDVPTIIKLPKVDFEDSVFPPNGWQTTSMGVGWYRSDDGGTGSWTIPSGDGFYALSNDNVAGVSNDGSNDYLITPEFDLSDCVSYQMKFDYFFDGDSDQNAYVEYSIDAGTTWEVLQSMPPVLEWTEIYVDLAFLSGSGSQPVLLAFHADDNGDWASGWAVDNIEISNYPLFLLGYYIHLNDALITYVPYTVETYTFVDLTYGQEYYASVRALYACGASDEVGDVVESAYLHPPRNLTTNYVYGTDSIPLMWNPPLTGTIPMAAVFSIVYCGPQTKEYGSTTDAAKEITIIEFENKSSRDLGWQQFAFPDLIATGEAGCETDGEFIYTVLPDGFVKYDIYGNLIEQFSIPGVSNIKDLAFDGEFFYGAAADPTIFVMDFNTHTLVTSFTAPADIRAIAYNDDNNTFYGNNWGSDIINFDASGNNLGSFTPSVSAIYGLAYDKWSIQGVNTLWAYDQGENKAFQFALPEGTPTGFVEGPDYATGLAGGLFTHPGLYEEGEVTLGGNAQDDKVWGIHITNYNTTAGLIPDGLTSFNIYQDGVNIANIPYQNELPDEWITHIVEPLDAGSYLFCVDAVYELTNYGFPGDYSESQKICGDSVTVVWGSIIPYFANWNDGTFGGWTLNENPENWIINTDEGEPAPSAQFSWNPILEGDYSSTLTSDPIIVDSLTEGYIFLDFDLKLVDRNSTGEEKLIVEIYNGNDWNQVAEFANSGKSNFTTNHIDISEYSEGKTIKIRFNVVGQNSYNIESWFIDNISVTRQCRSPEKLTGNYFWSSDDDLGIEVCWEAPDTLGKSYVSLSNNEISVNNSYNSRSIDGFNVYRMHMDSANYKLYDIVALQSGQTSYCYMDKYPNVNPQSGYYYKVTASYSSEIDECESPPALSLEIPEDDFVYVFVTGTDLLNLKPKLKVFPVPAYNILNVSSSDPIIRVSLSNYTGQVIFEGNYYSDTEVQLKTDSYPSGMYLIKIETEKETFIKKIILNSTE